jgi:hypothetical protein
MLLGMTKTGRIKLLNERTLFTKSGDKSLCTMKMTGNNSCTNDQTLKKVNSSLNAVAITITIAELKNFLLRKEIQNLSFTITILD